MLNKLKAHLRRIGFHLGNKINTGSQEFNMQGYYASRLDWDANHEPYMLNVLREQIEGNDGVFLDVGVNVGQTLLKVLEVSRGQRYIGFEPLMACCFHVQEFIRLNNLSNASLIPVALSDSNGTEKFYFRHQFDDMASLEASNEDRQAKGGNESFSYVQTRVGDELIAELKLNEISAIKIDVEGAEIKVLKGLKDTLSSMKPVIIFEVLPNFYLKNGYHKLSKEAADQNRKNADEIYDYLTNLGYRIFLLDHEGKQTQIDAFQLDDASSIVGTNYVARG